MSCAIPNDASVKKVALARFPVPNASTLYDIGSCDPAATRREISDVGIPVAEALSTLRLWSLTRTALLVGICTKSVCVAGDSLLTPTNEKSVLVRRNLEIPEADLLVFVFWRSPSISPMRLERTEGTKLNSPPGTMEVKSLSLLLSWYVARPRPLMGPSLLPSEKLTDRR